MSRPPLTSPGVSPWLRPTAYHCPTFHVSGSRSIAQTVPSPPDLAGPGQIRRAGRLQGRKDAVVRKSPGPLCWPGRQPAGLWSRHRSGRNALSFLVGKDLECCPRCGTTACASYQQSFPFDQLWSRKVIPLQPVGGIGWTDTGECLDEPRPIATGHGTGTTGAGFPGTAARAILSSIVRFPNGLHPGPASSNARPTRQRASDLPDSAADARTTFPAATAATAAAAGRFRTRLDPARLCSTSHRPDRIFHRAGPGPG